MLIVLTVASASTDSLPEGEKPCFPLQAERRQPVRESPLAKGLVLQSVYPRGGWGKGAVAPFKGVNALVECEGHRIGLVPKARPGLFDLGQRGAFQGIRRLAKVLAGQHESLS